MPYNGRGSILQAESRAVRVRCDQGQEGSDQDY